MLGFWMLLMMAAVQGLENIPKDAPPGCSSSKNITLLPVGSPNTTSFSIFFVDNRTKEVISPWHDLPLFSMDGQGTFNFVCEIPAWRTGISPLAKFEVQPRNASNPIIQDTKNGMLRYYPAPSRVLPANTWNYGMMVRE